MGGGTGSLTFSERTSVAAGLCFYSHYDIPMLCDTGSPNFSERTGVTALLSPGSVYRLWSVAGASPVRVPPAERVLGSAAHVLFCLHVFSR